MSREKNMNNNHVKPIYNFLIALVMTIGIFSFLTVKASASVSLPAVSSRGYLEVVAIKDIAVYRDSRLTTRGTSSPVKSYNAYISRNDVVYIYGISSTYCYISYPTSSGRRLGYCNILDLLFRNCCDLKVTSQGNCTVYKNYSDGIYYGSIAKNDTVYIIGKCNNMLFTVYSARSGNRAYKAGWISIDKFESTINPQHSPSSGTVYYVTTNGASLILRSSPSTSGSKRATMPNGSKVTVYSIQNGWASLNYNE